MTRYPSSDDHHPAALEDWDADDWEAYWVDPEDLPDEHDPDAGELFLGPEEPDDGEEALLAESAAEKEDAWAAYYAAQEAQDRAGDELFQVLLERKARFPYAAIARADEPAWPDNWTEPYSLNELLDRFCASENAWWLAKAARLLRKQHNRPDLAIWLTTDALNELPASFRRVRSALLTARGAAHRQRHETRQARRNAAAACREWGESPHPWRLMSAICGDEGDPCGRRHYEEIARQQRRPKRRQTL